MSQVRAALLAVDFDTAHAVGGVFFGLDVAAGQGLGEAGPTGAGIELCVGRKERRAAADAGVDTRFLVVPIGAGERALRARAGTAGAGAREVRKRVPVAVPAWR